MDLIISIILIIVALLAGTILRKDYLRRDRPPHGMGRFFFIALINPEDYFKRETRIEGYIIYLIEIGLFILAFYLLIP